MEVRMTKIKYLGSLLMKSKNETEKQYLLQMIADYEFINEDEEIQEMGLYNEFDEFDELEER
jgi:hypothetical protein